MYSSITPRRRRSSLGDWVVTTMSGMQGVVHEAGVPLRPSISTRHRRHEPNGSRRSVAHSLGTSTPASAAARMTDVPSGTATCWPSMVSATVAGAGVRSLRSGAGVPRSRSTRVMRGLLRGRRVRGRPGTSAGTARWKSSAKWCSALRTGSGVRPPIAHSEASAITSHRSCSTVRLAAHVDACTDLVDHLDAHVCCRCGRGCTCRSSRRRRTPSRSGPAPPCRRCRRTRRCRRGRPGASAAANAS